MAKNDAEIKKRIRAACLSSAVDFCGEVKDGIVMDQVEIIVDIARKFEKYINEG